MIRRKMPDYMTTTASTKLTQQNQQQNQRISCSTTAAGSRLSVERRRYVRSRRSNLNQSRRLVGPGTTWNGGNLFILVTAAAATAMTVLATERKLQTSGRVIFKMLRNEPLQFGQPTTTTVMLKCTHHDEFFYANPASKCSSYYRCYQRQAIRYRCNDRSIYDFYQQKCVRSEGTCYEPICTGKTNGVYADTSQACRRSYECQGGRLITMDNCPQGHLFDGYRCTPQHEVTCESPATSAIAIPFKGDDRCYGLQNGNHIIEDDQCKKFMVCQDNSVVDVLECPSGYVYNNKTGRCTYTGSVGSSGCMSNYMDEEDDACSRLPDGLHLDPTSKSCKSYIKCLYGKVVSKHDCPKSSVFNGVQCIPDFLYHCPRLILPTDICEKKNDGYFIDPRKGCSYFVRCMHQKTVENHSCPSGFQFNPTENLCMERVPGVICQEIGYSGDCIQRPAGFYQDFSEASKCAQYFYCFNGNKTTLRCPANHVFDGENCVHSSSYSCPSTDSDSCVGKSNGYHRDSSSGCRSYFYCSEGGKTSFLCNTGQIFSNGHCVDRLEDSTCDEDLVCVGKSDGYYKDLLSNCRNYFYCQKGEKLQTLTCRGSKIFNGNSCVSQNLYTCPQGDAVSDPLLNCIPRTCSPSCSQNGFQTDYDSRCENYHFCIDAKKTVLSCSNGYIFNGEICVPSDTYYCPKYCDATVACS